MTTHSLSRVEPPPEASAALTVAPRVIGRFFIRGEIGRGSNGVVYSAHDPILDREVAIKAIPLSHNTVYRSQAEANFINEAKAAARLNHPHIVTVFDAGKSDQLAYIAMERLRGEDLHDVIARGERMGWRQVTTLMARVADAVHFAHKRGLIHRDIKPSNIFLTREGKPKVLDFGVALMSMSDPHGTQKRQLIGTPNYMSPEQARGEQLDARSDIFSLGAILYELLAGVRAFDGKNIDAILAKVISGDPTPLALLRPDLPEALQGVVARAIEKDPEKRYQTAGELRNQLAICAGRPAPPTVGHSTPPPQRLKWLQHLFSEAVNWAQTVSPRALAGLAAALFALVVGAVLVSKLTHEPAPVPAPTVVVVPTQPVWQPPQPPAPPPRQDPPLIEIPEPAPVAALAPPPPATQVVTKRTRNEPEKTAPLPPPADGIIALAVAPWGEVLVNGVSKGVSPPVNQLSMPPGIYLIEIRNGAAPPFVARVEVQAGKTLALQHRF